MTIEYTATFSDKQVFDKSDGPIKMTLGDDAWPYGVWKSIEHMRKGEKSLISIKPKFAFGRPEV